MKFDSVMFDVDSTLTTIEGLDFLAKRKGKGEQIQALTKQAMGGNVPMREAMKIKMEIISPSFNDLVEMGKAYVKNVTPGAKDTIQTLKKNGLHVWIVTGNFQPGVGILAEYLGFDHANVITNKIFFDIHKNYKDFDLDNPLSNNGGKAKVLQKFRDTYKNIVFVGDGNTDLETKSVVDLFIGFGGVIRRPHIAANSDIYVEDTNIGAIIQHIIKP
jgi:phosphoserine phosphatase